MCLALPAKILEKDGTDSWVEIGESRLRANLSLTPEAEVGDWVLVHAGFAIQRVPDEEALATWELFESLAGEEAE